ncbi:MAG: DNA integrity scanning protein DisA nucleotide-binding domain protein, partial [Lachnospiraceae bacterium]|nr:DNA integrity scanning protein DisA nucleotide-binding domain protein [Lachnospiraceae bacterium]
EHNTPLHDGAVIIKGDRIVSATCYLPLSDNMELSKELGTRHRAAVGISEVTDSFTIVVSEETGKVSVASGGQLLRNIDGDTLRQLLVKLQNKTVETKRFRLLRGKRGNNEEISNK